MENNITNFSSMLPENQGNTPVAIQEMIMNFKYFDNETKRMLCENPSLLGRFLDKAQYDMVKDLRRDIMEANGRNYVAGCKAISMFQVRTLEEILNDWAKREVVTIRSQTINLAAAKLNEVKASLSASQHQFLQLVESNIARCQKISADFLREAYMKSIEEDTLEMFSLYKRLSQYFASFIDTTIGNN